MTVIDTAPIYTDDPERFGGSTPDVLRNRQIYALPNSDQLRLDHVEQDPESGEVVQYLSVEDPYFAKLREANPHAYEYARAEQAALQEQFAVAEEMLRANPGEDITAMAQDFIYNGSPTMRAWRTLLKEAKALYPLQRPEKPVLPDGTFIDNFSYERFAYSLDAVGIRTRAVITRRIFAEHVRNSGKQDHVLVSLGAGAAVPVYETLEEVHQTMPKKRVEATAVDMSTDALAFAEQIGGDYDIGDNNVKTLEGHLVRELMKGNAIPEAIGKKADMVDLLGVFEYFPAKSAALLLNKAFEMVEDDGILVFGNMLITHPNLQVNQRGVGWPDVQPRTIEEITQIIKGAGIDMAHVSIFIPEDGVYAVVRIEKPTRAKIEAPEAAKEGTLRSRITAPLARAAHFFAHRHDPDDLGQAA